MRIFRDRHDAGAQLALALHRYADANDMIVLAHTHSSVPVAYEIATRLGLPLAVHGEHVSDHGVALLVDDGDAGREMPVAIEQLRCAGAQMIVAAIGVACPQVYAMLHAAADHMVCVITPQRLFAVEAWYADHAEPSEADIQQLLVAAAQNLLLVRRVYFLGVAADR